MTDQNRLKALLDDFGVYYTDGEEADNPERYVVIHATSPDRRKQNDGYVMFQTWFSFDEQGEFENVGLWE